MAVFSGALGSFATGGLPRSRTMENIHRQALLLTGFHYWRTLSLRITCITPQSRSWGQKTYGASNQVYRMEMMAAKLQTVFTTFLQGWKQSENHWKASQSLCAILFPSWVVRELICPKSQRITINNLSTWSFSAQVLPKALHFFSQHCSTLRPCSQRRLGFTAVFAGPRRSVIDGSWKHSAGPRNMDLPSNASSSQVLQFQVDCTSVRVACHSSSTPHDWSTQRATFRENECSEHRIAGVKWPTCEYCSKRASN